MITVGCCPNSNGLLFYNPIDGTFVSSIDYVLQPNVTNGARFGYKYQPGTFIYCLDESTTVFQPKFPLDSKVLVHTHCPLHNATIVGIPTYDRPEIYTLSLMDLLLNTLLIPIFWSYYQKLVHHKPMFLYYLLGFRGELMRCYFYTI
jgi:hypothetical protein